MPDLKKIINLLIDGKILKSTCFMCYKQFDELKDIYDNINIDSKWFTTSLSLKSLTEFVFPTREIILSQACSLCSEELLNSYIKLRIKESIEKYLSLLIDKVNSKIKTDAISKHKLFIETEFAESSVENKKELDIVNDNINEDCIDNEVEKDECENFPVCFQSLPKQQLKTHLQQHKRRQRKSYSCDLCNYSTKCKTTLEGHKNKNHFRKRPHQCCNCSKSFYTKSALSEHIKTHEHTKDTICEICGDSFYHSKSLKDHLKLHSNDKTYECYVCNHRFVNLSRVNNHMKQKHGEKKEFCVVCGKRFVFKKDMRRHLKLVHKQEEPIGSIETNGNL